MSITLKEIANLTDSNAHTEAYIAGCRYLGFADEGYLITSLRDILVKQNHLGYLPGDLNTLRYKIYKDMMNIAQLILDEKECYDFYYSF